MELAFTALLILLERLSLPSAREMVWIMYVKARDDGFTASERYEDEHYLTWESKVRIFVDALAGANGLGETEATEIRDLKSILKRAEYVICDKGIFTTAPSREADVHARLEGILRCHYDDLKSKPALSKPIKNFEADTGIPSIRTLIEYKFISTKQEARIVADQILADVSGYRSVEWNNLLFVIYETHRVMPEKDWQALLKECGLGRNYDAVVLSGVPKAA